MAAEKRFRAINGWLIRAHSDLLQLSRSPLAKALPSAARAKLFEQCERLKAACATAAKDCVDTADQLRTGAKDEGWFSVNDAEKQMDALHRINLAWSYYPAFTDEKLIERMHEIHSSLKGSLRQWRYDSVMERDRLEGGRVFADR